MQTEQILSCHLIYRPGVIATLRCIFDVILFCGDVRISATLFIAVRNGFVRIITTIIAVDNYLLV